MQRFTRAYFTGDGVWRNTPDDYIGKRSRYYHANMDMDYLEEGKPYRNLKPTYVIFICTFDYVGAGKGVYFFQTFDVKNELYFDDFRYTIILNTKCDPSMVPEKLKPLFAYINDPEQIEDEFIQSIEERVQRFNSREWRNKQMTLAHLMENAEERGRKEGEARVNRLNQLLIQAGRVEDLEKASKDEEYQKQLFVEFNL